MNSRLLFCFGFALLLFSFGGAFFSCSSNSSHSSETLIYYLDKEPEGVDDLVGNEIGQTGTHIVSAKKRKSENSYLVEIEFDGSIKETYPAQINATDLRTINEQGEDIIPDVDSPVVE